MKLTDKKFWIAWTLLLILIVVWCMIGLDKEPKLNDCNFKGLSHKISQDCVKDTSYTTFAEYEETVLEHEQKIITEIMYVSQNLLLSALFSIRRMTP